MLGSRRKVGELGELGLLGLLGALALGCHAQAELAAPEPTQASSAYDPGAATQTRELALRYQFALEAFNRGAYEDAAGLFAQVLLDVPPDPSGDTLRHLLIQHIGWSLLGAYDMRGDAALLDAGEQTLERYLVKHEALLPDATAERADIYALLGEYQVRRAGQPPPDAHAQLEALVEDTRTGFEQQLASRLPHVADDGPIRIVEVETIPWAKLDDPDVQMFLRLPAGDLGAWRFDSAAGLYHPTRVLVRGRVGDAGLAPANRKQGYELLRAARPELERCYEDALVRGAEIVERVELELGWQSGTLGAVDLAHGHALDPTAQSCVRAAVQRASASVPARPQATQARLSLTFFVQFEQRGPSRSDGMFGADYIYQAKETDATWGEQVR